MRNLGTILAAAFLALVLLLYMCTFQVRFTEVAIQKTWGKPHDTPITEPSLYFKWPSPIQTVVVYDKRLRILEDRTEETRTVDGKNVLLTTFTLWKIADPTKFHTNFPAGEEDGERKLRTTVGTLKHAVTGQHLFSDFVSTQAEERKIRAIEEEMRLAIADAARDAYGIEVVDFGLKKLALPQSVTTAVFESMKSHEKANADRYTAEGEARAADILANARATEGRIMAAALQIVADIKTEAEAVVSNYYKEFEQYPELRIFLDKLRAIAESLRDRTTIIFDSSEPPWDVFTDEGRLKVRPTAERASP